MKRLGVLMALICGCAGHPMSIPPLAFLSGKRTEETRYRPTWTKGVEAWIEELRACIDQQPAPVVVLDLQELGDSLAGVTFTDGSGRVERCAAEHGAVLLREPAEIEPEQFVGRPLLALGVEQPPVAPGILLEEVAGEDDAVLGWLYWPKHGLTMERH